MDARAPDNDDDCRAEADDDLDDEARLEECVEEGHAGGRLELGLGLDAIEEVEDRREGIPQSTGVGLGGAVVEDVEKKSPPPAVHRHSLQSSKLRQTLGDGLRKGPTSCKERKT